MLLSKCMWVCGVGEVHHNVVEQVYVGMWCGYVVWVRCTTMLLSKCMCVCVVQANV